MKNIFSITKPLFFLISFFSFFTQAQELNIAKLDSLFDALEKNDRYMGSIAMSLNGQTIYTNSIGYDDFDSKKESSLNTKYRIGSISKMFTSVLIFKAIEEGKINLEQTLDTYFPSVENSSQITIGNLLNHRSGIYNFTNDPNYLSWNTQPKTKVELLEIIKKNKNVFKPNSKSEYSNSNYVLLTFILEKIYKKSYTELVETYITEPVGLKNTYVGDKIILANNESNSYKYVGQWEKENETDMSIPLGAGSMVSNPTDLNQFIEALFAHKLISEKSLSQMTTIQDNYGMGIFQFPFYKKKSFGHTGGIDGFSSFLGFIPENGLSISLISNGSNYNGNDILIGALSCFYNKPYEIPAFSSFEVSKEDLTSYSGTYSCSQLPIKITASSKNGTLVIQATGQPEFPLEAIGKHTFENRQIKAVLEFVPQENKFTLKQGGGEFLFKKE